MPRISWLLLALAACGSPPSGRGDLFREARLATVPETTRIEGLVAFSEDGRRVAYVERDGGVSRAVNGSWKSPPFSLI